MKKLLSILLVLALCFSFAACGGGESGGDVNENNDGGNVETVKKIEKNIDAVAAELGFEGGEETLYEFIGATAGKEYNEGAVELYQFDVDSDVYKGIEDTGEVSSIKVAAYKDGIALIFAGDVDQTIVDAFNAIEFE